MDLINKYYYKGKLSKNERRELRIASYWGVTAFAGSALTSIFYLYNVDLYLNVYQLDEKWFYVSHILFSVWNAVNDPLFGYLGDFSNTNISPVNRRLRAIQYGGPLWALVFLIPWFQFVPATTSAIGLHFLASLFLFDAMLTWVQLNISALLADLTSKTSERASCTMFSGIGNVAGALTAGMSRFFFDKSNLVAFQVFCSLVAIVAGLAFYFATRQLHNSLIPDAHVDGVPLLIVDYHKEPYRSEDFHNPTFFQFLRQLLKHKNFWIFVTVNFVQVFQMAFSNSFLVIFVNYFYNGGVINEDNATWVGSVLVLFVSAAPPIATILAASWVKRLGYFNLVFATFILKIIVPSFVLFWSLGGIDRIVLSCFLIFNSTITFSPYHYFSMVISDLAEEDYVINEGKRSNLLSAMFFGVNALFTKPAQSLAPVVGWKVLSMYGISEVSAYEKATTDTHSNMTTAMLYLVLWVPIFCGVVQTWLWSKYSLKGETLEIVKEKYSQSQKDSVTRPYQ